MINFLKKYYLAFVLALIVGSLTLIPQLYATKSMGANFKGVFQSVNDDDIYYLARAKDIMDGYFHISNPYLYEHKYGSPMQFWLPDFILVQPLNLFGVDVVFGYLFYDFLLPFLLTLLTFSIIYLLTRSRLWALAGTIFIHLGMYLEYFNRSPSPQLIFIFFLLLLLFLLLYLKTKKPFYITLSIFSFGSLFYLYPYYWTFYLALFGIFILIYFFKNKLIYKPFLYAAIGGLIIGIPYFWSMHESAKLISYDESLTRLGMLNTHFPSGIRIVFFAFLLLFAFLILYRKKIVNFSKIELFLFSGVLSSIICVNQHIITGKNLEFSSHYQLISEYWFIIFVIYLITKIIKRKKNRKLFLILIFTFVIIFSVGNIYKTVSRQIVFDEREVYWQNYKPIFDWLNKNTEKDSVVYANDDISTLIPAYTNSDVFFARAANLFFITDEEVQDRFVLNNFWEDYDYDFILKNERAIWGTQFINAYGHKRSKNKIRKLFGIDEKKYERIPQESINNFQNFVSLVRSCSFEDSLNKYKVDYFIWDKNKNPNWKIDELEKTELVFEYNNIFVYKYDKNI